MAQAYLSIYMTTEERQQRRERLFGKLTGHGEITDVGEMYDGWVDEYEKDHHCIDYIGPSILAAKLRYFFHDNTDIRILDLGCGTGWVAIQLAALGYTNIDGVDASTAMLAKAMERQLYKKTVTAFIGRDPLPLPDNSYDAVIGSGILNQGYIPAEAITDLYRLVKPGGMFMLLGNRTFWYTQAHHHIHMQAQLDKLEREGKWSRVEESVIDDYAFFNEKTKGHFFAYRKIC